MSCKDISKLTDLYSSTVKDNLKEIEVIVKQLQIIDTIPIEQFSNIFNKTSHNLVDKWNRGQKSLRTEIAFKIIPNYPTTVLKTSLTLDAMINLLDDILDELMEKEERGIYIIELIRVLAIFNQQNISTEVQNKVSEYFNKILCIAITEIIYKEKIKKSKDFNQRLHNSIQCYNYKSMDMDIFIELPLIEVFGNAKDMDTMVALGRVHRAVCIIKKDFKDLKHDIEQNTETPIVVLSEVGKEELMQYILQMMEFYKSESKKIRKKITDKNLQEIANKFQELILKEIAVFKEENYE
ncbi:MAG: hypothetical protein DRN17_03765 [Thermoplasmata archaeon]|nr:MAG: hypothetical protein DRN17_03765 [Thermoplasmata archaeon]